MRNIIILLFMVCMSCSVFAASFFDGELTDSPSLEFRNSLLGTWYVKMEEADGGYREEFFSVEEDGTFRLRFLSTNRFNRLVEAYAIVGIWGVAEDILFTTNLRYEYKNNVEYSAYLGDPHEFNAYKILEINESFLRNQSLGRKSLGKLEKLAVDPCKAVEGEAVEIIRDACASQDRILQPAGSNNGSEISLAE